MGKSDDSSCKSVNQMQKYRWIVFDADGTLFDYEHAELSALTRTFEHYGVRFDPEVHRLFTTINGRLWDEFELGMVSSQRLRVQRFEELIDALEVDVCPSSFSRDYLLNLGADSTLLPGAIEVVERLSEDCGLVLATNGIAEVQNSRFSASSIKPYFTSLVISDEINVAKPDPGFFSEVFRRIGNPERAEALMVGDGLSSDIAGGVGFGIDTVWFNPSGKPNDASVVPTYEVSALSEILDLVREVR